MSAERNRKEFECLPPEQRQAYVSVEPGTYIPLEISVSHMTCHMTMHVLMYVLLIFLGCMSLVSLCSIFVPLYSIIVGGLRGEVRIMCVSNNEEALLV